MNRPNKYQREAAALVVQTKYLRKQIIDYIRSGRGYTDPTDQLLD